MNEDIPTYMKVKREDYYNRRYVQFELIKAMKNREVVFLSTTHQRNIIRGMYIHNIDRLNNLFKIYDFFNKNMNIYVSVAKFGNIPPFTYNLQKRNEETQKWWEKDAQNEVLEYDLFLDFDIHLVDNDLKRLIKDVVKMVYVLKYEKISFNLYPSGSGFQMNIKTDIKQDFNSNYFGLITHNIKEMFNLKSLDLKGIGGLTKIRKCEYSLVWDKVCLPFKNPLQIELFNSYDLMELRCVMKKTTIKKRGLMYNIGIPLNSEFIEKYNLDKNMIIYDELEV